MNAQNSTQNNFFEILHVSSKKVSCSGGKGASGHPLVYLDMGNEDHVICPYCSKYFTIKDSNNDTKNKK